jgi:hypothetical protein
VPGAITIVPPPPPPVIAVQVSGTFDGITEAVAKTLTAGARFPPGSKEPLVEVLAVRPATPAQMRIPTATGIFERPVPGAVRVPAVLRIRCTPARVTITTGPSPVAAHVCRIGDTIVTPGATLSTAVGATAFFKVFDVSDADRSPLFGPGDFTQTLEIAVRFLTSPETVPLLSTGATDRDPRLFTTYSTDSPAVLRGFRRVGDVEGRTTIDWNGGDIKVAPNVINVPRPLTMIDATLMVPVSRTPEGWEYKGVGIKVGGPLWFEGPMYILRGWILSVKSRKP